jgi:hypothetical protein
VQWRPLRMVSHIDGLAFVDPFPAARTDNKQPVSLFDACMADNRAYEVAAAIETNKRRRALT